MNELETRIFEQVFNNKTIVKHGPFQGMKFDISISNWGGVDANFWYLMGSQEFYLWRWINQILQTDYDVIIDIGCASGYYLNGFAKFAKAKNIIGYDIDQESIKIARKNAELNDVESRITFKPWCDYAEIDKETYGKKSFIMSDIEGAEYELLDPKKAKSLLNCDMLIELHRPPSECSERIFKRRYGTTHRIDKITNYDFKIYDIIPEFHTLAPDMAEYLDERRGRGYNPQEWLLLTAKRNKKRVAEIFKKI